MAGRRYLVYFFSSLLLLLLSGCGQQVRNSLAPIQTSSRVPVTDISLVLMPLADYSAGFTPYDAMHRQLKVQQALSYYLAQKGYYLPLQEDVVRYLSDLNVIKIQDFPKSSINPANQAIYTELGNGWSREIVNVVTGVVQRNDRLAQGQGSEMKLTGLTPKVLQKIGAHFGANYVLRGRIFEYGVRNDSELNPVRQGILSFIFDASSRTLLGFAQSRDYDSWQDVAIGSGAGSWMANTSNAVWGGFIGGGSGYLISKGGNEPVAVVRIGLALQDPETGRVVWSNWVEKQVRPSGVWSDKDSRARLDRALDEAAYELVNDLVNTLSGIHPVKVTEAVVPEKPVSKKQVAEPEKKVAPAPPEPIEEEPVLLTPKKDVPADSWGS